jgi:hypothetical protein
VEQQKAKAMPYFGQLVAGFPPQRTRFEPGLVHAGFVVDRRHCGRFSPRTSISPTKQSTDCNTLINIHHPGWYNRPIRGFSERRLGSFPPQKEKKKIIIIIKVSLLRAKETLQACEMTRIPHLPYNRLTLGGCRADRALPPERYFRTHFEE